MATTYTYSMFLQLKVGGNWAQQSTKSVPCTKDTEARYTIRIYKHVGSTTTQLNGGSECQVYIALNTSNAKATDLNWTVETSFDSVVFPGYKEYPVQTVHSGSDTYFVAGIKASTLPASVTPKVHVYVGTDTVECIFAPSTGQTAKGITKPQTLSYTAATNTTSNLPMYTDTGGQTDLNKAIGGDTTSANVKWDAKTNRWVVLIHKKEGSKWLVQIGNYDSKGKQTSLTPKKYDTTATGKNFRNAQADLLKATQDTLNLDTTGTQPAIPDPKAGTFNPPNHFFTRRPSFAEVAANTGNANIAGQIGGHHALGRIVQDKNSAKLLNVKMGKNPAPKDVFGFRFSYNPTTIAYATNANAPIDWTLGTSDTANILGGPTMVGFDLYLNRIADVHALTSGQYKDNNYVRPLTDVEKLGIRTRGTEYDLEFLYRVVNGTPVSTDLTLDSQVTSDFGYITGVPFWLYIHDNMRYFGGLSALNVNHVIFSTDMVPIFTVVSVTFNRYPVFDKTGYVGKKQGAAFQESQSGKTTGTTTPPG
jgi:hypothetical protein